MQPLSLLTLGIVACGSSAPEPGAVSGAADTVTIVHSARLDGEIEPCG